MPALNDKCTPVDQLVIDGLTVCVGDLISYDVSVWNTHVQSTERRESFVTELWHEDWPHNPDGLNYAELENGDRAWFHRDHVGAVGDLGAVPSGALF